MVGRRVIGLFWIFILAFFVLLMRLMQLSLLEGATYTADAVRQQEFVLDVASRRGVIYDAQRRPLSYTKQGWRAVAEPSIFRNDARLLTILAEASEVPAEELSQKIAKKKPFAVELTKKIEEEKGLSVIGTMERDGSDRVLTQLLGTTDPDDQTGLSGLEKSFDRFLAGSGGKVTANVTLSASGEQPEGTPAAFYSGSYYQKSGLVLTIDKDVQEACEAAADQYVPSGAIVVSDIKTGEIRAMVSRPGYAPSEAASLLNSSGGEFINRALTTYDAGSVFKIIVTAAALENGGDIEKQQTTCDGFIDVSGRSFACHVPEGHGTVGLDQGFAQSCNPFFIEAALKLGLPPILEMAQRFGIGSKITLAPGIASASASLPKDVQPTPPALLANTAIGQGDVMLTPLDVLSMVSTVANGGIKKPLKLVSGFLNADGSYIAMEGAPQPARVIKPETAGRIAGLMTETCVSGTGKGAVPDGVTVAGKTASAQTGWRRNGEEVIHGWFAGYFPADNPKYAAVVVVENGRTGSQSAAPAFKEIAEALSAPKATVDKSLAE